MRNRIIPARAGFTRPRRGGRCPRRDHPRSRGVYGEARLDRGGWRGIIPARAGFTGTGLIHILHRPDHPRSRGVYVMGACRWVALRGSSPLARGLRTTAYFWRSSTGIIPARAGFTVNHDTARHPRADHPRSRGVYCGSVSGSAPVPGSSPLARGLLDRIVQGSKKSRIIPARAGFTGGRAGWCGGRGDHPRSRGVYPASAPIVEILTGSSPLARGLPTPTPERPSDRRIIPARAGFTVRIHWERLRLGDHPRSRGVY